MTSSGSAVITEPSKPTVFSEQDWNLSSIKEVEEMGNKCRPGIAYCASKTLAEKGDFFGYILLCRSSSYSVSCNQRPGIFMSNTSPK